VSKMSDQDIAIQQAYYHSPLEICRRRKNRLGDADCICGELMEAMAEQQERCARVCEELADRDVSMVRAGAYLNAANRIRGKS
jgi:lipoate synthase